MVDFPQPTQIISPLPPDPRARSARSFFPGDVATGPPPGAARLELPRRRGVGPPGPPPLMLPPSVPPPPRCWTSTPLSSGRSIAVLPTLSPPHTIVQRTMAALLSAGSLVREPLASRFPQRGGTPCSPRAISIRYSQWGEKSLRDGSNTINVAASGTRLDVVSGRKSRRGSSSSGRPLEEARVIVDDNQLGPRENRVGQGRFFIARPARLTKKYRGQNKHASRHGVVSQVTFRQGGFQCPPSPRGHERTPGCRFHGFGRGGQAKKHARDGRAAR